MLGMNHRCETVETKLMLMEPLAVIIEPVNHQNESLSPCLFVLFLSKFLVSAVVLMALQNGAGSGNRL